MANTYLYEKMIASRPAEVRRDIHLDRKYAHAHIGQLPTMEENDGNRFGTWPVEPGTRVRRMEQRDEATVL